MIDVRMSGIGMTSARTRDRLVQRLRDQGITSPVVLDRIRNVPRHIFVDEALGTRAYEDTALPIGFGQTISQPYIVARMTEALLAGGPLSKVLEVGTGCGYQSAVLAPLVTQALQHRAHRAAVPARQAAAFRSWICATCGSSTATARSAGRAMAPFDGILVAAAPISVPEALLKQLQVGGRLIVPVGAEGHQELIRFTRKETRMERESLGPVAFVPLLGGVVG